MDSQRSPWCQTVLDLSTSCGIPSWRALARETGICRTTFSAICNGRRQPTVVHARAILEVLVARGVDPKAAIQGIVLSEPFFPVSLDALLE